jgi:hypothetical protein
VEVIDAHRVGGEMLIESGARRLRLRDAERDGNSGENPGKSTHGPL